MRVLFDNNTEFLRKVGEYYGWRHIWIGKLKPYLYTKLIISIHFFYLLIDYLFLLEYDSLKKHHERICFNFRPSCNSKLFLHEIFKQLCREKNGQIIKYKEIILDIQFQRWSIWQMVETYNFIYLVPHLDLVFYILDFLDFRNGLN